MPDMLSTIDNPYNPHTQYDQWYAYDYDRGYHTPGLLGRVAMASEELSDADLLLANEQAMNEIIHEDLIGVYIKVGKHYKPRKLVDSSSSSSD